mmetsp:Transcript_32394/g.101794  ORF Transcript_32394/g.101794 Transcript_32394/m.101794 type:complete len:258 (+) Transcript_32394:59-832(+)
MTSASLCSHLGQLSNRRSYAAGSSPGRHVFAERRGSRACANCDKTSREAEAEATSVFLLPRPRRLPFFGRRCSAASRSAGWRRRGVIAAINRAPAASVVERRPCDMAVATASHQPRCKELTIQGRYKLGDRDHRNRGRAPSTMVPSVSSLWRGLVHEIWRFDPGRRVHSHRLLFSFARPDIGILSRRPHAQPACPDLWSFSSRRARTGGCARTAGGGAHLAAAPAPRFAPRGKRLRRRWCTCRPRQAQPSPRRPWPQ